jgi:hypothetical protein
MGLSSSKQIVSSNCVSTTQMRSYMNSLSTIYSNLNKKNTKDKVSHGMTSNSMTISVRILVASPDFAECIRLIEANNGLLNLVNEECRLPKGSESSLVRKMSELYKTSKHFSMSFPLFVTDTVEYAPRFPNRFEIIHYAGVVSYTIDGFLDKNRNACSTLFDQVILTGNSDLVKQMFPGEFFLLSFT